jgi:signal transduction histidine kinase
MWHKLNLRSRIYLLLACMICLTLTSGVVMIWYTYRIQAFFSEVTDTNLAAFETAAALEVALVNQKGFVTYFFLDNDPAWLDQLAQYRQIFRDQLIKARGLASDTNQQAAIEEIAQAYQTYIELKDRVIELYKKGSREEGMRLHQSVRLRFFEIIDLCEANKLEHLEKMKAAQQQGTAAAVRVRTITMGTIAGLIILLVILGVLLIQQILTPVYQLLKSTSKNPRSQKASNVVSALSTQVDTLLKDVDLAHRELEKSRENLQQAEKMALVGKLAAGMAHSIRNPFTSVKMRLFSLGRTLKLNITQQEDFEVISQEIRHIDTIVQNFLEFSRPPKLVMQAISPSTIVDHCLQLLSHRLDSYGVAVDVVRPNGMLPEVNADPEQLKEVLANLIINACEEMKSGGSIVIEEQSAKQTNGAAAVLRITDSGPGIPSVNRDKIFNPFFTTKDEGTGLGLSISRRIVSEHGGTLQLDTQHTAGATFIITLPVKESL